MQLKHQIDDVIEALRKAIGDAGDSVAVHVRRTSTKLDELHTRPRDLDNTLAGLKHHGPSKTPDAITDKQYKDLLELSVHNPDSPRAVLGKFRTDPPTTSYIDVAAGGNPPSTYFSVGDQWDEIKAVTGMNDDGMFESLNKPFLDRIVAEGKEIQFSHDPDAYGGALAAEMEYLSKQYDYILVKDGDKIFAVPPTGR